MPASLSRCSRAWLVWRRSALRAEVAGPGEAEEPVAADPDRDREQQHRAERLVQHLVQRLVEAAGLLRAVVDAAYTNRTPITPIAMPLAM